MNEAGHLAIEPSEHRASGLSARRRCRFGRLRSFGPCRSHAPRATDIAPRCSSRALVGFFLFPFSFFLCPSPALLGAEAATPEGLQPLAPAMLSRLAALQAAAARIRGLAFVHKVPAGQLDEPALKKKIVALFNEELPPVLLAPLECAAKSFSLIPQKMDLGKYYPELLTSQVGGYYDPKRKYLALVDRPGGVLGADLETKLGPEVAARMTEMILLHELVHALQDQHFGLEKFGHDQPLSDSAAAKMALIEGDATLGMYTYLLGFDLERLPMIAAQLQSSARDIDQLTALMPDLPGARELREAPAYLRDNLLFSYIEGLAFCVRLKETGGRKLLDYAFTRDPPRSTEQILHPEKWLAERDDPVTLELPDLTALLPGYQRKAQGQWGELNARLLLSERLGPEARAECDRAAAGWGGDTFAVFEHDGQHVVLWWTEWDTEKDAQEFLAAARSGFREAHGWDVHAFPDRPRRVLVSRGRERLPGQTGAAVMDAFQAAPAGTPANARLDLAALGLARADKPAPVEMQELMGLFRDPAIREILKFGLEQALAQAPGAPAGADARAALEKLFSANAGEGGLEAALKDPALQKAVQDLLGKQPELPKGQVAEGVYTNEALGISIRVPLAPGWQVDPNPANPGLGPTPLAIVAAPKGAPAKVVLAYHQLPMAIPIPIEQMGPMFEMGFKIGMQDYQQVKQAVIECGSRKGLELEFTGKAGGEAMHCLQCAFLIEGRMLLVVGNSSAQAWPEYGAAIREVVESFRFIEAKPCAPARETVPQHRDPE